MLALRLEKTGETPVLIEIPTPLPGAGEVLLKIEACGLNFADLLTIQGQYQEKPALPSTMGMELAGTVLECGSDVSTLAPGMRVAVYAGAGGLAEKGVFSADQCIAVPDAMPMDHAAAFLITYGTSHVALVHRAQVRPGETVLVLGAAGGVGLTAVEIAARLGARVIACARGEQKLAAARAAGAHETLDSTRPDLKDALKKLGGVDVVYDPVGDPLFSTALRACKPGARYLVIGFAAGKVPQIPANYILVKNITVHGFYWGGYRKLDPAVMARSFATLMDWYADGGLRPHISHRLPLEEVLDGLELLRSRQSTGKVVIVP